MATDRARTPTEKDLLKLPHWAIVAFAARCARRVQPLFAAGWKDAPKEHIEAVDRAITLSEISARIGHAVALINYTGEVASKVASDAGVAIAAANHVGAADAAYAAYAAHAAHAVSTATTRVPAATAVDAADVAAYAYAASAHAAAAIEAVWFDYDRLLELAMVERWTRDTPVDPDRLGPLWPFGRPQRLQRTESTEDKDASDPPVLQVDIVAPSGMTPAQSDDFNHRVASFYAALSGLHAAMGGTGLRFLDEDSCEAVPAEDEAPLSSDSSSPHRSSRSEAVRV